MRVSLENLDFAALSRTTRWRATKRGWACPGYHTPELVSNLCEFERFAEHIQEEARHAARTALRRWRFPRWVEFDDLTQEALLATLRLSGKQGFRDKPYRFTIMLNRLRSISQKDKYHEIRTNATTSNRFASAGDFPKLRHIA